MKHSTDRILTTHVGSLPRPAALIAMVRGKLRGEAVDPAAYYFRTTPRFESAHPAYAFLNHLITVATGDRRAQGPIYTIHELL